MITLRWTINPRKFKDEVIENRSYIDHPSSSCQVKKMEQKRYQLYISILPSAIFKCDIALKVDLLKVPHEETQDIVGLNSVSDVWPRI